MMSSSTAEKARTTLASLNFIARIVYGIRSSAPLETLTKIILVNAIARNVRGSITAPAMHESRESVSSSEVDGDDSGYEADADEPKEDSKGAGEADNAEEPDSSTDGTDTDTDTSHNWYVSDAEYLASCLESLDYEREGEYQDGDDVVDYKYDS
ncbi:hypothetical protein HO173_008118 [Letharia columbiana]|uniref:Uncharacterized protein n=1 Tax=Letharia columbiana TaxID=112416 RepID=A0A8H6FRS4_9LECA|nr:uncharacterized protein HO173_008118 [Letharia columbiana]KAF6233561.1 hypothetical protein HO173_008118 [Letharia columbiana]